MFKSETHNGVKLVQLVYGKVNAFDVEFVQRWVAELNNLERDDCSAVVLTGSGSVFSAGVDLRRLTEGGRDYVQEFLPLLTDAFFKTFTFRKPLVAAINGHAIAGGCLLACSCDYRIMAEGKGRIGIPEFSIGVPFPSVAMEILRLTVPPHRLQATIYGGLTYAPEGALQNGLVDEIAAPESLMECAISTASRLGAVPRESFALTKRLIRQPSRDRIVRYIRSLDREILEAWLSPSVQDAIRSYVERTFKK